MSARIFRTEIAGLLRVGIEFDSQEELDAFLGARGVVLVEQVAAPTPAEDPPASPDTGGRPSRGDEIAGVVEELEASGELADCDSLAERARLVRERIGADAPAQRTVETFLTTYVRSTTQKPLTQKLRGR